MSEDIQSPVQSAAANAATGRIGLVASVIILISCIAQTDLAISPFTMSAIVSRFHVADNVGGLIISLQLGSFALATFACSAGLDRLRTDFLGQAAAATVLIGQILSALAPNIIVMVAARTTAGLGAGLCVGIAYTWLAQQDNSARLLTIQYVVASLCNALAAMAVPAGIYLIGAWGVYLAPIVLGVLLTVLVSLALPRASLASTAKHVEKAQLLPGARPAVWSVAMVIICACMISACSNLMWVYSAQLGLKVGLGTLQVSTMNATMTAVVLIAPPMAYFTSRHWGELRPMLILCGVMAITGWYYCMTNSALVFVLSTYANNIAYVWAVVQLRLICAHSDGSGRSTAAAVGADAAGWLIGPLAAGIVGEFWRGNMGLAMIAVVTALLAGLSIWLRRDIRPRSSSLAFGDATEETVEVLS